jgi:hypothetical protein
MATWNVKTGTCERVAGGVLFDTKSGARPVITASINGLFFCSFQCSQPENGFMMLSADWGGGHAKVRRRPVLSASIYFGLLVSWILRYGDGRHFGLI